MRSVVLGAVVSTLMIAAPAAAFAEEAAPAAATSADLQIKKGAVVKLESSPYALKVDRVITGQDGKVESVSAISDGRFVYIPASTIKSTDKGYVTSLTRAEIRKLK